MCAIAGILGLAYNERIIQNMLASMAHRGPDGNGVAMSAGKCLLHTRLAIIDPKGGQQPMQLTWQGKRYTLIYNGELYNTEEVRKELHLLDHHFEGHSDTEVLLHAYAQWGEDCLHRLNGIFAFAVSCPQTDEIFLARDRMGVKPLFYMIHNGGLIFASEIKTILAYPGVVKKLDADGIRQLMMLGPGRIPGSGVVYGVRELEPGFCGYWKQGRLSVHRYWQLRDREHNESFDDTVDHVRHLVNDAITRQTVSDVPIGTFLSGGLDSSIITALCAREKGMIPTFSLDFHNNDRYFVPGKFQPASDNTYIECMQSFCATEHHWTVLHPEDLIGQLESATIARDLPGMADVDSSLLGFCGEISGHVKVALSGECADEIFGGYPWYRDPSIRDHDGFPWAQNTAYRAQFLLPEWCSGAEDYVHDLYRDALLDSDILPGTDPLELRMKQMVNLNQRWFMQTLLDRKDRMSMYHGLEVRVPFCDHRIAEYLYGVPWHFKDHKNTEKGLLRQAMIGKLPQEVLWRKKSPYPKTYDPRYEALVTEAFRQVLQNKESPIHGILREDAMERLLDTQLPWPWYGQLMQRPQTIAYLLQINFWLEHYHISIL